MEAISFLLAVADGITATPQSWCTQDGFKTVWRDDFLTPVLDNSSWTTDFRGNDSRVRDSQGTADNVYIENGDLVLRTLRQADGGYDFTSGAVQTQGKRSWRGLTRACVRALLPGAGGGDGIWPAYTPSFP